MNGMPAQQAFDSIDKLLRDCYRDWYLAMASLPQWGEGVDAQVQKYIQGVQDVALANLNWRFVLSLTLPLTTKQWSRSMLTLPLVLASIRRDIWGECTTSSGKRGKLRFCRGLRGS